MDIPKIKVYIETNEQNNIIKIFSSVFKLPSEGSILIDEGYGDKYAHAQSQYLEKPLFNMSGIAQYQYIDGKVISKTQEEIQAEIDALPKLTPEPTNKELEAMTYYVGMMTGVL